ncbi:ABHD11 [Symbiodinium natans]|uniref:ABHD11 protein n=1 Tax=Symbiodinium natans TaxID=878477 RepID=A0A812S981_9DINO|nr:ABHD11 [Symbiodinium natans]
MWRSSVRRFSWLGAHHGVHHGDALNEMHYKPALLRGSLPVHQGSRSARHVAGPLSLRFEVTRTNKARKDCTFIWTHGLTSSVESESEGGWPFGGVAELSDVLPVVRYDARGHGKSDASDACTWQAMGSDLRTMHETMLPGRPVVLGGTSMGAAASLYAALEAPEKVAALILATPPTCYETRRKFVPLYEEGLQLAKEQGLKAAKKAAASKARPPIFLETDAGRASFDIGWRAKFAMGQRRYCAALRGAIDSDLPPPSELKRLTMPILVLAWKSDAQHPLEAAELLCDLLPQAQLHVASCWADVEMLPQQMRQFLQSLP